MCLIIVFSYFIDDHLSYLNEVLHYLQTSYLRVVSGSEDHLYPYISRIKHL